MWYVDIIILPCSHDLKQYGTNSETKKVRDKEGNHYIHRSYIRSTNPETKKAATCKQYMTNCRTKKGAASEQYNTNRKRKRLPLMSNIVQRQRRQPLVSNIPGITNPGMKKAAACEQYSTNSGGKGRKL